MWTVRNILHAATRVLVDDLWIGLLYRTALCGGLVTGLLYRQSLCFGCRPTVPTVAILCYRSTVQTVAILCYRPTVPTVAILCYRPPVPTVAILCYRPPVPTVAILCYRPTVPTVAILCYRPPVPTVAILCYRPPVPTVAILCYRPTVPNIPLRWLQILLQILSLSRQADYPYWDLSVPFVCLLKQILRYYFKYAMIEYLYILPISPFIIIHASDLSVYKLLYTESKIRLQLEPISRGRCSLTNILKSEKIHTRESIN